MDSFHTTTCPVCSATWLNSQLYWSNTGEPGKDEDLNALVCRQLEGEKKENCVNPRKGTSGGIGWEERALKIELLMRGRGFGGSNQVTPDN